MSLIICTRDRAAQLKECLEEIAAAAPPPCAMEVIVVDNGSTDATPAVIGDFAATAAMKVTRVDCDRPGLGRARNAGVAVATGEWLLFTDDDCYVGHDFFRNFFEFATAAAAADNGAQDIRYGAGPVVLYDADHDPRIANIAIEALKFIPMKTLLPAGAIQGANMFFHRSVFAQTGPFNDRMGSGTPFACEDIEMATRASVAGFTGALVPFSTVTHRHRRMRGSAEANATVESYDYGRGAYYASLLERGIPDAWKLWQACSDMRRISDPKLRMRLMRELEGVASYFKAAEAPRAAPAERESRLSVG